MKPATRLTLLLSALMLVPVTIAGVFLLASMMAYLSPAVVSSLFSHWMLLLMIGGLLLACIGLAFRFSTQITEQLEQLSNLITAMNLGKRLEEIHEPSYVYREFRPFYSGLRAHIAFHEKVTTLVKEIALAPPKTTLPLRSEDDEFGTVLNMLITRLQHVQYVMTSVAEGHLTPVDAQQENGAGTYTAVQRMIDELSMLVATAREYTNQIVRVSSQINSITSQGLQDTKIATKRINDLSQSIHKMASNIQDVAEHLQSQSFVLDDTSSSIEHTMDSIENIAVTIEDLKHIVEKSSPSTQMSEETSFSLDLMYEATRTIETDARTCMLLSQEAAEDAEQGKDIVQQTIVGISNIQSVIHEFFEIVRELGERSEEVSETLEVISDVADHTNLLAINAAIISAHAGEHGRDFAVIADEIGKFAERTRESAGEIEELLRTIQHGFQDAMRAMETSSSAITAGVALSENAGKTLEKLSSSIRSTNDMVTRIAGSTADQSRENDHIRDILAELVRLQHEKQEQVTQAIWQLMQTISQIRGITTEQAEGSARIAEMAQNLDRFTQEIGLATDQHVTSANQIIEAVQDIRKLVRRTTLGTEKAAQLTNALFSTGGNLAFTMGEFTLSSNPFLHMNRDNADVIGFVRRGPDIFFDAMVRGIWQEADQYSFSILEADSLYEATTQVELVNWLLKQPALRGIILCPTDTNVAQKLVQKGTIRGIPFVAADETIPTTISVRSGNREGGRQAAELLIDALAPGSLVGVIVDRTVESMVRRALGFRQKAENYPLDLVEIYCDMTNRDEVKNYLVSALEENPGLQGLFLTNEGVTTEYLNALHSGILPANRLLAVGYDQTPLAETAIRHGELLGAIFQHPEEIGKRAFHYLYKLIAREIRVEEVEDKTIYIPTVQVTKANLAQFSSQAIPTSTVAPELQR